MLHPIQVNAQEIRRRLRLPPGGRRSSELEIVSEAQIRREALELLRAERDEADHARHAANVAAVARQIEASRAALREAELQWLRKHNAPTLMMRSIIEYCCAKYEVSVNEIFSTRRQMKIATTRQIIYYLCCELTKKSLPEIGRFLDRDHSSVLHGRDKMRARVRNYPAFASEIAAIKAALGAV